MSSLIAPHHPVCCVQTPDEKGDVDPYVELLLFDPATKESKRQETSHLQNEPNPKWGEKFDFPMVSAPSILTGDSSHIAMASLMLPPTQSKFTVCNPSEGLAWQGPQR